MTGFIALDKFERVDAEFIDTPAGRILVLMTQKKSWGPNYLNFGFSMQSDFSNNTHIDFDVAYILKDITDNGGQWKNELSVGWETLFSTEFKQPIGELQTFYTRARFSFSQDKWAQLNLRPELENNYLQTIGGFGINYDNQGVIELGLIAEKGDLEFNNTELEGISYKSYGGYLAFGYDNLNSINFPTSGNKLSIDIFWREDKYQNSIIENTDDNSVELQLNWRGAVALGQHTFVGIASFASLATDNDFSVHISELGGFLNLSGYNKDALIGTHKVFSAIVYQYDLGREFVGDTSLPLYLGTSIEMGNVWSDHNLVSFDDLITSGSLYLGTDTTFGPACIRGRLCL